MKDINYLQHNNPFDRFKNKPIEKCTIEEMGIRMGDKQLFLYDSFLSKKLNLGTFVDFFNLPAQTNIKCPFCKDGILILTTVEPNYSGGRPSIVPYAKLHHVGNSYNFKCSDNKCKALFFGNYTWMHID
jgi:hypothetical protein